MSDDTTLIEWEDVSGVKCRFTAAKLPGSAHWSIRKDEYDRDAEEWERIWATEARTKPKFPEVRQ